MTSIKKGTILSTREHVLQRPDMYIGSVKNVKENTYIFENDLIIQKEIGYNEGLERTHLEILTNAIDNKWESEEIDIKMTKINISIDKDTGVTTISNDGRWIPIEKDKIEIEDERDPQKGCILELYRQEAYFGYARSGTNYDDKQEKRKTAGKNGIGAKATNIYSKEFTVTCIDPENKKKYIQTFKNNMSEKGKPTITRATQKTGYTEISYIPDFERFGLKGYDDDTIALFEKHAYDCAMTTGLSVTFNDKKINIKNLAAYTKLYCGAADTNMLSFESEDCEVVLVEQSENVARKKGFKHISFVNGTCTKKGGVHVDKWIETLLVPIRTYFNQSSKTTKSTKSTKTSKTDTKMIKVTLEQIKKYFLIFVKAELDKPDFESQSKHELKHPAPQTTKPTETQLKKMLKWNFVESIRDEIRFEEQRKAPKNKKGYVSYGQNVDDANWSKSKDVSLRSKTMLFVTEGLSAKAIVAIGKDIIKDGHNKIGALALRGKIVNATKNSQEKVNNNKEIQLLKQLIGLEHGVDYSDEDNIKSLRYGRIVLLTDSDDDGSHIEGLVLNYFWKNFRDLFEFGIIKTMRTPSVKLSIQSEKLTFFSHNEFEKWQNANPRKAEAAKIKYYKGLGTSSNDDAKDIFKMNKQVEFMLSDDDDKFMRLAFEGDTRGSKNADKRKKWLTERDPMDTVYELDENDELIEKNTDVTEGQLSLSDFVNYKLFLYHRENISRMVPDVIDGLKEGQRKIIYTCFKKRLFKKSVKVVQLGGSVLEHACYHHGEASLYSAIIKLAQGFVGARNIPLLVNDGQFGTRIYQGKDASAARYICTRLEKITCSIFINDDFPLLERVVDEGDIIEPKNYVPIIPMILINGSKGIATGWSTTIPNYNPLDCVEYIKRWIDSKENGVEFEKLKLVPWWRGYNGEVTVEEKNSIQILTTEGKMENIKGKYHITELPIRKPTAEFGVYLNDTFVKNKHITSIDTFHGPNTVHFVLTPHKDFTPDISTNLKSLVKTEKISNMVTLVNGSPRKFNNVYEIIEHFCEVRYDLYTKRRNYTIAKMRDEKLKEENKVRFIDEVTHKRLVVYKRDKSELVKEMKEKLYAEDPMAKYNVEHYEEIEGNETEGGEGEEIEDAEIPSKKKKTKPYAYLTEMPISSMGKQKLEKLNTHIKNIQNKIDELEKKTNGDMWLEDLENFEKAYEQFLKTRDDGNKKPRKDKKDNA